LKFFRLKDAQTVNLTDSAPKAKKDDLGDLSDSDVEIKIMSN